MTTPALARRPLLVIAAIVLTLLTAPNSASAHTDVDFTLPDDGASVSEPVTEVTVGFTAAVELVGNGFEALDPQGTLLQPPVVTDDDRVYRLQFDPPLAGGAVGVRYEIRADDGHVLSGSFSFVVDAPAPTTPATPPSATTPPATAPPATTAPSPDATDPASTTTTVAEESAAPATTAGLTTTGASTDESSDGGSNTGVILAIVAAIGIGLGGFFVLRSRTSGAP